jgi:hypothetical protein
VTKHQPLTAYVIVLECYDPPLVAAVFRQWESAFFAAAEYPDEKKARIVEMLEVLKS